MITFFKMYRNEPRDKPWVEEKLPWPQLFILVATTLSSVLLTALAVVMFYLDNRWLVWLLDVVVGLIFFVIAAEQMFMLYNKKQYLEQKVWELLKNKTGEPDLLGCFQASYRDSVWIGLTPPFALVIYLSLICWGSLTNMMDTFTGRALFYKIFWLCNGINVLVTVKFVNDLYNIVNNLKKMMWLERCGWKKD